MLWPVCQPANANGPVHMTPPRGVPKASPALVVNAFSVTAPAAVAIACWKSASGLVNFTVTWWAPVAAMEATSV